jgi:hypothetical protein
VLVNIPGQNLPPYNDPLPSLWMSNTEIYLDDTSHSTLTNTYLLDVTQVRNQTLDALPLVTDQRYVSAAISGSNLYLSQVWCQGQSQSIGIGYCTSSVRPFDKSMILQMPAQGGPAQTVYESANFMIDQICVVNAHTLLFVENDPASSTTLGFWTVNTDGSNARKLTGVVQGKNIFAPFVGDVSPDGTQFLVQGLQVSTNADAQMYIGSLQDGSLSPLPDTLYGGTVGGWTQF